MYRRTRGLQILVAIAGIALLQGCGGPDGTESTQATPVSLDCPADRIATVTDLHTPDGICDDATASVGDNLKSHHYRVACEGLSGIRPPRVESVQASACRQDDRGAWTDVEICCPEAGEGLTRPRRMRLAVQAPAVGEIGTASVSLMPPKAPTEYRIRISPESCDVYRLHPSNDCEFAGAYAPGQTSTFMVGYRPGSTHRRGGVLTVDFVDPTLSDVEVRLSGGVGDGDSDWLSVPITQ